MPHTCKALDHCHQLNERVADLEGLVRAIGQSASEDSNALRDLTNRIQGDAVQWHNGVARESRRHGRALAAHREAIDALDMRLSQLERPAGVVHPMTRTYISGPISLGGTVDPGPNLAAFASAAEHLAAAGHVPISPADIGERDGWTWTDYLRACLLQLLCAAEGVALLPGWEASRGARLERTVALELGMDVRPLSEWLGVAE